MGTKKKLLFVFNPFSGKAQIKNQLLDIVDVMVKADYEVTIYLYYAGPEGCGVSGGTCENEGTGRVQRRGRYTG